ncbi:hypothetical protein [Haloferula helveola]
MKYLLLPLLAAALASCAPSTPEARISANPSSYWKLSDSHQELVRQGRIENGMPPEAVELAWGRPSRRYDGQDGKTKTSRWDYAGSKAVYSTRYYGGYGYGPYGRYGRYGPRYAYGLGPEVDFVPYRRASVWFRNDRVTKWERSR